MKKEILKTWITNDTDKPFYTRKPFLIDEKVHSAKVAICGLGQFQLYVNGQKVSDHVLDPAWTDYKKLINYLIFDITDMLRVGENVIAAEVGNGWFLMDNDGHYVFHFPPFMPPNPNVYQPYGDKLVLSAHVELTAADGSVSVIDTDDTWKVAEHEITHSNVFGSETIDGRKRIAGWNDCGLDDADWASAQIAADCDVPKGILEEQIIPPVKVIKVYDGKYLYTANDKAVYDFEQNVSGMLEFEIKGKSGDVIHIYPAEKLDADGNADQMAKNWMLIDVCETYIIGEDDTWEAFSMTFTYFGGRYIAVEGCEPSQIKNIRLRAISSAYEAAGSFTCDDERYLQIYDLVEKAVEANMVSVHTDCPTIERFAWQEENHLMAPAVMYMKQVKSHWEKFLKDTRLSQHTSEDWFYDMAGGKFYPGDGLIPSQAPCYMPNVLPIPGMGSFYDVIGWGSSIILGTYWHYQFYGDGQIIADNYEAGKRYLEYLKTTVTEDGFINHGLGDWGNPVSEFARENVETAFLYADAKVLAEFAGILGKNDEQKEIFDYAEKIKVNYNDKLLVYNEDTKRYCYRVWTHKDAIVLTQASQAMPLFWGLVPKEAEADIVANLREIMEKAGAFQTGEVGQPYIIQTMAKYGMNDLISKFIVKDAHPSYYAFILEGETTLGEYWEGNPRSHCHDMMGHIIEWYYNGIAGIKPVKPGFAEVLIQPCLPESMNEMSCTYHSVNGPISVSMKRNGSKVELKVDVAEGIEYTIDDTKLK